MSYIVFARKYRPQVFDDIAGQSHITTTLKNAISQNRVAHAYIFAGPRGVGKTTTARILAKALDCELGPAPTPCNSCASCSEIAHGSSLDILEIDGASNRGIEEIRNLKENVKFAPSRGKFKVYIIDEVHMLTEQAFNALLKTLEEPPPHVKFIFATTQAHKVPATILSRCQRFDFRRISTKEIFGNLKRIVEAEKLKVTDEALSLIAKCADGSMRDGQVVLDQIISFVRGNVLLEDVAKILGLVDEEVLFGMADSIKEKNTVNALKIIDALMNEGRDVLLVVSNLIGHFRNLAVVKVGEGLGSLIDAGPDKIKRYEAQSQEFAVEDILYIIYTLANTIDFIRRSNLARIPFEAAMVKLTRVGHIAGLAEVMERIERLEKSRKSPPPAGLPSESSPSKNAAEALVKTETVDQRPSDSALPTSAELDEISSAWTSVINYIKTRKISVASYLQEGYPVNLEANNLTIGFPKEFQFHKEVLDTPENRRLIEEAVKSALKLDTKIALILVEPIKIQRHFPTEDVQNNIIVGDAAETKEGARKGAIEPIIKDALEVFGGEIADREVERKRAG